MATTEYEGCNKVLEYLNWYKQQIRQVDINNAYLKEEYNKQNTLQNNEVEIGGDKFDCTQCSYIGCCHNPPSDKKHLTEGCIKCLCQNKYTKCKPCIRFNNAEKCQPFLVNNQLDIPYPKFQEYPAFQLDYQCVHCVQQINAIGGGDVKIDNVDQTMQCILNNTDLSAPPELDVKPPESAIASEGGPEEQLKFIMSDKRNMIIAAGIIVGLIFLAGIVMIFLVVI